MNNILLEQIVMESTVLYNSTEWLGKMMDSVVAEIDLAESSEPLDAIKLGELEKTLSVLYGRARVESKICDQFYLKYAKHITSGKSESVA